MGTDGSFIINPIENGLALFISLQNVKHIPTDFKKAYISLGTNSSRPWIIVHASHFAKQNIFLGQLSDGVAGVKANRSIN